ncbi:hypothetical protein BH10CHL1_BH10CHL1_25430 [soil metagenome]
MLRKSWITLGLAVTILIIFTVIVAAQQATPQPNTPTANTAQIQPLTAAITQQVPISLTLRISSATGVQTVTVPVLLNLNIQVGLARPITSALGISVVAVQPQATITPTISVITPAPATPTAPAATATPTGTTIPITGTPTLTTTATPTVTATPTRPAIVAPACPSPGTVILAPGVNQVLTDTVNIVGTAQQTNFDYYKLEYAVGANAGNDASAYNYFAGGSTPITNSVLGVFDTLALPNRAYTLRLTVVDKTGNFPLPCKVTVLIQNP